MTRLEVFPDNPAEVGATGVSNLRASLQRLVHRTSPTSPATPMRAAPASLARRGRETLDAE